MAPHGKQMTPEEKQIIVAFVTNSLCFEMTEFSYHRETFSISNFDL
jgi:hypothetical protein